MTNEASEREAFEAWLQREYPLSWARMTAHETGLMWDSWQARAALPAAQPVTDGVMASPAGQPFFTAKDIALATMTPEQEAAAQQGRCPKCDLPSLSEKHREGGVRWLQCSRCTSVYALGVPASLNDQQEQPR
jgi:hypothetical protein